MISANEEWRQSGTGAWLGGAEALKGFCQRQRPSTPNKKCQHIEISNIKIFEQIELPEKLLDYFLRSNKSNIHES